jgi:uncharacterized phage-like protein YoqJ
MKLSKSKLKQIIREELANLLEAEEKWILRWSGHGSEYLLSSGEYGSEAKAREFATKELAKGAARAVKKEEGYTLMPEKKKDK